MVIQETRIDAEELAAAQYFHGHKCPAMPQGLRAGHLAMDVLGVERARGGGELIAIVETGEHHFSGCFVDGVMFATGCTVGKGNLIRKPLGKFAVTLIDTKTRRAVRVVPRYERMSQCLTMDFFKLRAQGVPPYELDPNVVEPLIEDVLTTPWDQVFSVQTFDDYPYDKVPEVFDAVQCAHCGELVVTSYAVRLNDQWYCGPCLDEALHTSSR
ncbi:tungsten formylmethanofuran dehydrogenase, subunit E, putative [Sulfobacillus acidophilus TPY]|uniref:Formylmethanofuran dehydrogenase, subunit E n=1 Tax=Sulfobacillus acidophilus (strain ATCC 700253 / DSM 10332 / NAL) TaxID=679936 RepID=G8TTT6_SULAD|nr:tungsten formylmethanofuran dehydrogenase, subunit E, putative [Sulfobacillus acidophilus TPY]AEW06845.1 formylmethanofuran dehydrogenase, subunit E [Sulfobacillus acidophilus DSM 10332]